MTSLIMVNGLGVQVDKKIPAGDNIFNLQIAGTTDVVSIQRDGTIQHRPKGSNGNFERFTFTDDGYCTVICDPPDHAFSGKLIGDSL